MTEQSRRFLQRLFTLLNRFGHGFSCDQVSAGDGLYGECACSEKVPFVSGVSRSDCSSPLIEVCQSEYDFDDTDVEQFVIDFLDGVAQTGDEQDGDILLHTVKCREKLDNLTHTEGAVADLAKDALRAEYSSTVDEVPQSESNHLKDAEVEVFVKNFLDDVVRTEDEKEPEKDIIQVPHSPKNRRPKKKTNFSKLLARFGVNRVEPSCNDISLPVPESLCIRGPTGKLRGALLDKDIDDMMATLRADVEERRKKLVGDQTPFRLQISTSLDTYGIGNENVKSYNVASSPGDSRVTRRTEQMKRLIATQEQTGRLSPIDKEETQKLSENVVNYSWLVRGEETFTSFTLSMNGEETKHKDETNVISTGQDQYHSDKSTKRRSRPRGFFRIFRRHSKYLE